MLITKQKHLGRDSFYCIRDTFLQTAAVERVWQRVCTSGRYRWKEEWKVLPQTGCVGGKHGVSSYVGQRDSMCGSKSRGVKPLLALCTWKKNPNLFTWRHYELMTSKEENLISYKRHSDARLKRSSGIPMMGVVDFELLPGICVLSRISVCFVLVVCQGIPMQVLWLKIPFPGILFSAKAKIDQSGLSCLPTEPPSLSHLWPNYKPTTELSHARTSEWMNLTHRNLLSDVHMWPLTIWSPVSLLQSYWGRLWN